MSRFHRGVLAGFLAGGAGLVAAINLGTARVLPETPRPPRVLPAGPLDPARYDPEPLRAEEAKAKGLFWLSNELGRGVAVRLLDSPELFDEVFPGYEEARGDAALWRRYFRQTFDLAVRGPALSAHGDTMLLNASWIGSFELFKSYGADLLVFGASELFMNASPSLLRDGLAGPKNRSLKILFCGTGSMMPETVRRSAEAMRPSGRKARAALWGYSLWNAYKLPFVMGRQREKWERLERWTLEDRWGRLAGGAVDSALRLSWGSVIDLRLRDVLWKKFVVKTAPGTAVPSAPLSVAGLDLLPGSQDSGWMFPASARRDERLLAAVAARTDPYYYGFIGVGEKDCDMTAASSELDQTLKALLDVSERVVLIVPPATPLLTRAAPACFAPAVESMLRSKEGPRVTVILEDWKGYGLSWTDFVWPAAKDGYAQFNFNHVNFTGARKFSERLAALSREQLFPAGTRP